MNRTETTALYSKERIILLYLVNIPPHTHRHSTRKWEDNYIQH